MWSTKIGSGGFGFIVGAPAIDGNAVYVSNAGTLYRLDRKTGAVQWKVVVNELQQVPRWNKTNTGKILDQLAEKLTHRSLVVILSDFFDDLESIRQGLRHLRYKKHEMMIYQILDPTE
ncbi:MAG: PQQ-binding-like beta-propeller repeat protein, partial [Acidimicrobiia bacterium]